MGTISAPHHTEKSEDFFREMPIFGKMLIFSELSRGKKLFLKKLRTNIKINTKQF